ncbi:MAG TPA: PEP-CTERM sorting domain-containing protein [Trichormus sp. M33_DOE_039]|nr:PEP-CTERM sorting domain-containing protein [Trichormus sp. M33_DOE_039]
MLLSVGLFTSSSAKAAVLIQDNFDVETLGLNYNSFANWNVTDGTVDLIGNPNFFDLIPGNGRYVDLDGSTANSGILASKTAFNFNAGDVVNLVFDLAGNRRDGQSDSVTVSLGSLFNETFTLASNQGFTTFTRTINVTSATTANLAFAGAGGDNIGLLLDDVILESTAPTSVPEPASILGLLAFGALGIGSLSQRQQQANKA